MNETPRLRTCHGCPYLLTESDIAGGGVYKCAQYYGLILGEWGHWTDERDAPRPLESCL